MKTEELFGSRSGQSLAEILIAIVVGGIVIMAAVATIAPAFKEQSISGTNQAASAVGKELVDNIRSFSEGDWHGIYNLSKGSGNHYYLSTSSPLSAVSGDENVSVSGGAYTRYFYVENVSRDASDNIETTYNSLNDDPSTQKVTVVYGLSGQATSSFQSYLTRHRNNVFLQTDWSGGPGQESFPAGATSSSYINNQFSSSTNINYSSTTGSIFVKSGATSGNSTSSVFDTGMAGGAEINSIMWDGSAGDGTVKFQLASSNSSSGPWTYVGRDGTNNTYYTPSGPGSAAEVNPRAHNNKRYFRYEVFLSASSTSPRVDDVVIGWSP